jgi:membrane protease subunit HflK
VIAEAEGEASRFLAVLAEYEKAPEVTRKRLYLETVQDVLGKTNKVMLDVESGNSLMYLPLDKLMETRSGVRLPNVQQKSEPVTEEAEKPVRETIRSRRTR